MTYYRRAFASIKRKPGKSLILLLLVFILGTVISGAISISQAVVNTERGIRRSLPPVVTITEDWEAAQSIFETQGEWPMDRLTPQMLREISQLPYVQTFDYSLNVHNVMVSGMAEYHPDMAGGGEDMLLGLRFRGVSNPAILDMTQGMIELVDGRVFTQEEVEAASDVVPVLVSESFAAANGLSLGSTFEPFIRIFPMTEDMGWWGTPDLDADPLIDETFTFMVIGLFDLGPNRVVNNDEWGGNWQELDALNRIYAPNINLEIMDRLIQQGWALQMADMDTIDAQPEYQPSFDNIFVLYDMDDTEAFRAEAGVILPPIFRIMDLSSTFAQISASMETMLMIAKIVLYVSVGATLVILSLLITLFLRDRKHEIGIYLALGEKKGKIIAQILLEVLSVSILGITLSLFAGNLISDGISSQMLQNNMLAQMESGNMIGEWNPLEHLGFGATMTMDEMLASYEVSLDGRTVLFFYLIGAGAVIVSTIVPILYVTSLNPKKILM